MESKVFITGGGSSFRALLAQSTWLSALSGKRDRSEHEDHSVKRIRLEADTQLGREVVVQTEFAESRYAALKRKQDLEANQPQELKRQRRVLANEAGKDEMLGEKEEEKSGYKPLYYIAILM